MKTRIVSGLLAMALAACGAPDKEKQPAIDGKDGLDRFDRESSAVSPGGWTEIQAIDSPHPYTNSYANTWSVSGSSGTTEMRVAFERFELENGYDFLIVSDASGDQVTRNTGTQTTLDQTVPGDRVELRMSSDSSITGYGFRVHVFERRGCACPAIFAPVCGNDGTTYSTACAATCAGIGVRYTGACAARPWDPAAQSVESVHPYANSFDRVWTLSYPGATSVRLHFTRIDVERGYDFVRILDASGAMVHEYTGRSSDVTTPAISGNTLQVQLASDRSITGYGFAIDRLEVQGPCAVDSDCGANQQCLHVTCIRAPCFPICSPINPGSGYQPVALATLQQSPQLFDNQQVEVTAAPQLGNQVCTRIACSPQNPCCNRCSAGYNIGGDVTLANTGGQGFGCSGDSCNPAQTCTPAFGQNAGEYVLRGTFHLQPFGGRQLVVDSYVANTCHPTGCSGQVCGNTDVVTGCDVRAEYVCYQGATCAAQSDGFCNWTQTADLLQCLANGGNTGGETLSRDTPLAIPDNLPGGVTSQIEVTASGARSIQASLAITHPYRGDLRVTLFAPNGHAQVLQSQSGGSFDDLILEGVDVTTLAAGQVNGAWSLRVEDLSAADIGTLDQWSLTVR